MALREPFLDPFLDPFFDLRLPPRMGILVLSLGYTPDASV
jgi:hypothetical protein